ncbi:alpha/beta hydrolase [Candidatus Poriferisodalis multihospitum]|uniref:alpha/beta hydrolase n=1 Tax=Candidatus Poriferisodalis multihospitum TaxID=2983191 RepID=UPI0023A49F26|nr:alpha/beta hydrolase [Candidatus Poriferisodalis multihospitum]MDE0321181.1 alpha/beta hydrolase [Acidimicrobiaceae bacterium]
MSTDAAPVIRRHRLSSEAEAYKARRKPSVPITMPDLSDHAAVARWRAETNALWGEDDDPHVPHRREVIGGVACLVAGPPPDAGAPMMVYAHGGGYVLGSAAVAIPITARLAASGLRVMSVDYRQPPEHPFPAALDDVLAVYLALAGDDTPVALAGDSSGGALALGAAVTATARGSQPAAVALFSPLLDHAAVPGSSLVDDEGSRLIDCYAADADPADPRLSPLRADLSGLPAVLVQAAADEPLASQAVEMQARAAAVGTSVTLQLWEHLWHTWHYHDLPEADQALTEAATYLMSGAQSVPHRA